MGSCPQESGFRKTLWSWAHWKIILSFGWDQVEEEKKKSTCPRKTSYYVCHSLFSCRSLNINHSPFRFKDQITLVKGQTAWCFNTVASMPCETLAALAHDRRREPFQMTGDHPKAVTLFFNVEVIMDVRWFTQPFKNELSCWIVPLYLIRSKYWDGANTWQLAQCCKYQLLRAWSWGRVLFLHESQWSALVPGR